MNPELEKIQKELIERIGLMQLDIVCPWINNAFTKIQFLFAEKDEKLKEFEDIYLKDDDELAQENIKLKKEIERLNKLLIETRDYINKH